MVNLIYVNFNNLYDMLNVMKFNLFINYCSKEQQILSNIFYLIFFIHCLFIYLFIFENVVFLKLIISYTNLMLPPESKYSSQKKKKVFHHCFLWIGFHYSFKTLPTKCLLPLAPLFNFLKSQDKRKYRYRIYVFLKVALKQLNFG